MDVQTERQTSELKEILFIYSQAGVVKLHISQYSPLFYTCHLDGVIRSWNLLSGECIREWHGHCASILDLAITR